MKKLLALFVVFGTSLSLVACDNMSNQDVGTVSGAVIGGLAGSQFGQGGGQVLAAGAGALAGAYIGGAIGKNMDDTDRLRMNQALESNPVGQPTYWQNKRTDTSYTVVPTKNVELAGNPYCREYRSTANIAGKKQQIYGTACRQPDGTWKIQDSGDTENTTY
ncbi:MAG: glycine zipper 2TM domain-containing protein [Gammaproteobacteria bacterium]|nr:glycine zipper 2TM domain-containing protein [Gammaproteobacteria bacterium]